jgi:hypothetical protein
VQVETLPVENTFYSKALFNEIQSFTLLSPRCAGYGSPCKCIRAIDKSKCSEDRAILAKDEMSAGRSAALEGVVHARQVIEQERGSVEVFECDSEILSVCGFQPVGCGHLKDQSRPDQAPWVG